MVLAPDRPPAGRLDVPTYPTTALADSTGKATKGETMKRSITFGAAVLALAAIAASCTSMTAKTPGNGGVYLVGVAGGG